MKSQRKNILHKDTREKMLLVGAGTKGGSGKSTLLANLYTWYGYRFNVVPKVWDLDRMQTLTQMLGASSIFDLRKGSMPIQEVLGSIFEDSDHSVFILDTPASSEDQVRDAFGEIDPEALYMYGVHVVLVASITKEEETVSKLFPWVDLLEGVSTNLFVRNWIMDERTAGSSPRDFPFLGTEDIQLEQGFYRPQKLLALLQATHQPLHEAVWPYLASFREPYLEAVRNGSKDARGQWKAIRDQVVSRYSPELQNDSIFMPAAMTLDKFYSQLDKVADELLPSGLQGQKPGVYQLKEIKREAVAAEALPAEDSVAGWRFMQVDRARD